MVLKQLSLAAVFAGLASSAASAQDFYFGGGLAYSSGTSDNVTGGAGESDFSAGMLSLILGQRFAAGAGFWGWETSADLSFGAEAENASDDLPCSDGATGSYLCTQDATLRLVGIYGGPIGAGTEVFGSFGFGTMMGDFASNTNSVESASVYGLTAGVGLNHEFGNGLIGRGEVIYDSFTNSTQDSPNSSEYSGTTLRFAVMSRF